MHTIYKFAFPFLFNLILILILLRPLRKLAIKLRMVDQPNHRKIHESPIPVIGGLVIFLSTILTLFFCVNCIIDWYNYKSLFLGSLILTIVGAIDDKIDIRSSHKLFIQLLLAHIVFMNGIRIESLYGFLGITTLSYPIQYFFTLIFITGGVNAFNLMDGIDGLMAGIACIALLVLSFISFWLGLNSLALILFILLGAVLGFLRFNLSLNQKVFMGDAGSLTLGFIIIYSAILIFKTASSGAHFKTIFPIILGIVFLPMIDSLRVYRRRIKKGHSPFKADRSHIHHLVLNFNSNHKKATILILVFLCTLISFGYIIYTRFGMTISILFLIGFYGLFILIFDTFKEMMDWSKQIKKIETKDQ